MAENGRPNRDAALMTALAGGATVRQAAESARLSERTAHRRLADPAFRRRVAELRGEMVARAMGKLADGMTEAAEGLRLLLGATSESVRLGAARALLELGLKLRESVEWDQQIRELEERVSAHERNR